MKQTDLKKRLYGIVLQVMMIISALSIIGNFITDLPLNVNIKWIVLFSLALFSTLFERYKGTSNIVKFMVFLFLTCILTPIGFVDAGGSKSDTIVYSFFTLILVTYIFEGYYRNILIASIIAAFMGMYTYEYFYPNSIPVYDVDSRFIDRMIQVPLIMFLCFLVMKRFSDAYNSVNQRLFRYAHYDELTGLLNRRNFNDILQSKIASGENSGFLIMMDIDNFKLINDKKGHIFGDNVLKYLSGLLNNYFSHEENMISRWGGDEFVIIYFGSALELNNILGNVKRVFKSYVEKIEPSVDISIGIAALEGCKTSDDVFTKSDQIMYEQKNAKKITREERKADSAGFLFTE